MHSIHITHNPFTVHTEFLIDGTEPAEGCKLISYRESRLQQWVEKLFDELRVLFNGDEHYEITFRGVESDFLDLQEAAIKAQATGTEVQLRWEKVPPAEHRLEQIRALWDEVVQHPQLSAHVQREAREEVEAAFNRDFDVYVVATMSSGKSTLINAMLGTSLLPAANEATTATLARITDNDRMPPGQFRAQRISREGELLEEEDAVTSEQLIAWNKAADTFSIHLEGDIQAIRERENVRLVLTDTPGPNNSQDDEHGKTTMKHIMDSKRNPLILYILNGTQLGIQDDKNLLNLIAEAMSKGGKQSKDRFIFVVSKMDNFDPDKESIPGALQQVRAYLESNGIHEPTIYPVSAEFTRLLRLSYTELTRKERAVLQNFTDIFEEVESMNLNQYMPITGRVKRNLEGRGLSTKEISSGLPAVEAMIDEYIDKYNLPHRLKRVCDALNSVIFSAINEAELIESLNRDEEELRKISIEIAKIEDKKSKGFDTKAFINSLKNKRNNLPTEVMNRLKNHTYTTGNQLREIQSEFQTRKKLSEAKSIVQVAVTNLRNLYTLSTATHEEIFEHSQNYTKLELKNAYQEYVKSIFNDANEISFPTLEKLKNSITSLANDFNFDITEDDVQTREIIVGHKEVVVKKWYKLFIWGDKKIIPIKGNEEYVDFIEYWKTRSVEITLIFDNLHNDAIREILSGHTKLIDRMLHIMENEFEQKFNSLLARAKEMAVAKENQEENINNAKKFLQEISSIRKKLNSIISIKYQHD
jgi:GTPase Era involved in 16S rRNA processing/uncharacterized protein (UPF0335 family)